MSIRKGNTVRRKTKDMRLRVEPELRARLEKMALAQRRSVPNLAEWYVAQGVARDEQEARA